jgi:trimeric autotransporter adhesin
MNPFARSLAMVTGLVLLFTTTSSWGQPVCSSPGCNPTASDGHSNTAGGTGSLGMVDETATGGFDNTAFGFQALFSNTTGDDNTAIGWAALNINTTGGQNTAIGAGVLELNTTGSANTAVGFRALEFNTTGIQNVAIGLQALDRNTTGSYNTATGLWALHENTTGNFNTAMGNDTLFSNTIGNDNTAFGEGAMISNTTGNNNTANGSAALLNNRDGNLNTATGFQALEGNVDGANNTAIGAKALKKSLGTKNIGIGYQAGVSLVNGNNNIYIGNQGNGDEFQTIRIGTAQTQTFMAGINTTGVSGTAVVVNANGQLGITLSSARYKQDIVLNLRPVTFAYKDDAHAVTHYGLIAEEVATVYPDLVTRTASGEVQTVKYQEMIPMLLNELQRQHQARQQERAELATLRQELAEMRALVGSRLGK